MNTYSLGFHGEIRNNYLDTTHIYSSGGLTDLIEWAILPQLFGLVYIQ